MELKELLYKPLPKMPYEISEKLSKSKITKTEFESKNDILSNSQIQTDIGYVKMNDVMIIASGN